MPLSDTDDEALEDNEFDDEVDADADADGDADGDIDEELMEAINDVDEATEEGDEVCLIYLLENSCSRCERILPAAAVAATTLTTTMKMDPRQRRARWRWTSRCHLPQRCLQTHSYKRTVRKLYCLIKYRLKPAPQSYRALPTTRSQTVFVSGN